MESKIIRIAQVIGAAGTGGVESCIMNYYKHIDKTKVQFDFFVESDSKIIDREKIESMGGKIVIIPPYTKIFKYIKELKRLFKEGKYDIVSQILIAPQSIISGRKNNVCRVYKRDRQRGQSR